MYWEEKIDLLKQKFTPTDFRVPFTDWAEVMKKIESRFIVKQDSNTHFNHWSENIKQRTLIKTFPALGLNNLLEQLKEDENYWAVALAGVSANSKHYIYDCKPKAIEALVSFTPHDFFIVDKKYQWFTYFQQDSTRGEINIYKSNGATTPFDAESKTLPFPTGLPQQALTLG